MVVEWGGPDNRTVERFSVQMANPVFGPGGVIRDPLGPSWHGRAPTDCGIRRTSPPSSLVGNGPTPSTDNGWRRRLLHPPVGTSGVTSVAGLGDATGDGR